MRNSGLRKDFLDETKSICRTFLLKALKWENDFCPADGAQGERLRWKVRQDDAEPRRHDSQLNRVNMCQAQP